MNIADLQATLRHFAAERDWQPFHTPKNLSTALMVEAAELAEIFQWMTPEESRTYASGCRVESAHRRGGRGRAALPTAGGRPQPDRHRAGGQAKLARNALKYPPKRVDCARLAGASRQVRYACAA